MIYQSEALLNGTTISIPSTARQIKIEGEFVSSYVHFYSGEPLDTSTFISEAELTTTITQIVKSNGPHVFNVPASATKMRMLCVDVYGNIVGGNTIISYR